MLKSEGKSKTRNYYNRCIGFKIIDSANGLFLINLYLSSLLFLVRGILFMVCLL